MQRLLKKAPVLIGIIVLAGAVEAGNGICGTGIVLYHDCNCEARRFGCNHYRTGTIEPIEVIEWARRWLGLSSHSERTKMEMRSTMVGNRGRNDSGNDRRVCLLRRSVIARPRWNRTRRANCGRRRCGTDEGQSRAERSRWNRAQELSRSKLISQADNDSYRANYESARANVAVGKAALTQAQLPRFKPGRCLRRRSATSISAPSSRQLRV